MTVFIVGILLSLVLFIGNYKCDIHEYGSQFYGHVLLQESELLRSTTNTTQNHTIVFNYVDKDDQIVTFAKFQIDGANSTVSIKYQNKTMEATLNAYNATNVTATAYIYGFQHEHINSHFIRNLYDIKKKTSKPLSFILNSEYTQIEEDIV